MGEEQVELISCEYIEFLKEVLKKGWAIKQGINGLKSLKVITFDNSLLKSELEWFINLANKYNLELCKIDYDEYKESLVLVVIKKS